MIFRGFNLCKIGKEMVFSKKNKFFLFGLLFFLFFSSVYAEYNRDGIPDSSEIRQSLEQTWFYAPLSNVRMNKAEIRTNRIGEKFQVRLEETEKDFAIFVSPHTKMEVDVYTEDGMHTEIQDVYPGDSKGSWVLIKDKKTGNPLRIRFYFTNNSEVYVQFFPLKDMAYADFVIYNCYASRSIPTGIPFKKFYTASFAQVKKWTESKLPWKYDNVSSDDYLEILQMIGVIREKLPELLFIENACYDEEGKPVYISNGKERLLKPEEIDKTTLSSAGFLKWIIDGINEPLTGSYLKLSPLTEETVSYSENGHYGITNSKFAISFTLDWTRNLAAAISSVRTKHFFTYKDSGVDVKEEFFSAQITEDGIKSVAGYIKDSGYETENLKAILYALSSIEPWTFYLAAVRETVKVSPEIKVFNECAAIFPYFDSKQKFNVAVFKDCAEVDFDSFCSRFSESTVHLVKVQTAKEFYPK